MDQLKCSKQIRKQLQQTKSNKYKHRLKTKHDTILITFNHFTYDTKYYKTESVCQNMIKIYGEDRVKRNERKIQNNFKLDFAFFLMGYLE